MVFVAMVTAASTSSAYVFGYGCPFPFLGGGIDHYSAHQQSNHGSTGAEQLENGLTLYLRKPHDREELMNPPILVEICSFHMEIGHVDT